MITAYDAMKQVEDNYSVERVLNFIEGVIWHAIEEGRYYCIISKEELKKAGLGDNILLVVQTLVDLGYQTRQEIDPDTKEEYEIISWKDAKKVEEHSNWIERRRWDGSPFYECSGCGNVAAAKKFHSCPHCNCKMGNGEVS